MYSVYEYHQPSRVNLKIAKILFKSNKMSYLSKIRTFSIMSTVCLLKISMTRIYVIFSDPTLEVVSRSGRSMKYINKVATHKVCSVLE